MSLWCRLISETVPHKNKRMREVQSSANTSLCHIIYLWEDSRMYTYSHTERSSVPSVLIYTCMDEHSLESTVTGPTQHTHALVWGLPSVTCAAVLSYISTHRCLQWAWGACSNVRKNPVKQNHQNRDELMNGLSVTTTLLHGNTRHLEW